MGLREKIALIFVALIYLQIINTSCMPRSVRKDSVKCYFTKNNDVSSPPMKVLKKSDLSYTDNIRHDENQQERSVYKIFNFPEVEYPLQSIFRQPFCYSYFESQDTNSPLELLKSKITNQTEISFFNKLRKEAKRKRQSVTHKDSNFVNILPSAIQNPDFKSTYNPHCFQNLNVDFSEVEYPVCAKEIWIRDPRKPISFTFDKNFVNNNDCECLQPQIVQKNIRTFLKPLRKHNQIRNNINKAKEQRKTKDNIIQPNTNENIAIERKSGRKNKSQHNIIYSKFSEKTNPCDFLATENMVSKCNEPNLHLLTPVSPASEETTPIICFSNINNITCSSDEVIPTVLDKEYEIIPGQLSKYFKEINNSSGISDSNQRNNSLPLNLSKLWKKLSYQKSNNTSYETFITISRILDLLSNITDIREHQRYDRLTDKFKDITDVNTSSLPMDTITNTPAYNYKSTVIMINSTTSTKTGEMGALDPNNDVINDTTSHSHIDITTANIRMNSDIKGSSTEDFISAMDTISNTSIFNIEKSANDTISETYNDYDNVDVFKKLNLTNMATNIAYFDRIIIEPNYHTITLLDESTNDIVDLDSQLTKYDINSYEIKSPMYILFDTYIIRINKIHSDENILDAQIFDGTFNSAEIATEALPIFTDNRSIQEITEDLSLDKTMFEKASHTYDDRTEFIDVIPDINQISNVAFDVSDKIKVPINSYTSTRNIIYSMPDNTTMPKNTDFVSSPTDTASFTEVCLSVIDKEYDSVIPFENTLITLNMTKNMSNIDNEKIVVDDFLANKNMIIEPKTFIMNNNLCDEFLIPVNNFKDTEKLCDDIVDFESITDIPIR